MRIVIEAQGGLCNRMRAIDSALALGQELSMPITVQWFRNEELNCPIRNLFDLPSNALNLVDEPATGQIGRLRRLMTPYRYRLRGYSHIRQDQIGASQNAGNLLKSVLAHGPVYISTYSRFYANDNPYRDFVLAPSIEDKVQQYRSFLQNAVAVHIRRTDNLKSIQAASIEAFVSAMEEEIHQDSGVQFFVATDEQAVLDHLIARFGGAVRFHPKRAYSRNDPLAIEDALIDLYTLASCRRLIGSYWSSFTDTAAQLGQIATKTIGGDGRGQ